MDKVTFEPHPDWASSISAHPASRPSRVEVTARGTTFTAERDFPKGSPSPDPATTMTTAELVTKFRANATGIIPDADVEELVDSVLDLEAVEDIGALMGRLRPTARSSVAHR